MSGDDFKTSSVLLFALCGKGVLPLTSRKEEQKQDESCEASFAPAKVTQFSGVAAGMEHRFLQLRRLRTRVT